MWNFDLSDSVGIWFSGTRFGDSRFVLARHLWFPACSAGCARSRSAGGTYSSSLRMHPSEIVAFFLRSL